ncbi:MAG: divalent cation tolerance protein CutA, partial [Thermodesulfobacteriota bacterium]
MGRARTEVDLRGAILERVVIVTITAPGEEDGTRIGRRLVEERGAACVNGIRG